MIIYTGNGMSGCTTSLKVILQVANCKLANKNIYDGIEIEWHYEKLILSVAPCRSTVNHRRIGLLIQNELCKSKFVDGLIFVVDSQPELLSHNLLMLDDTRKDLHELGYDPDAIPLVFQLNKRDLPGIETIENLKKMFTWPDCEYFETVATQGIGVVEAFNALLLKIKQRREETATEEPHAGR